MRTKIQGTRLGRPKGSKDKVARKTDGYKLPRKKGVLTSSIPVLNQTY